MSEDDYSEGSADSDYAEVCGWCCCVWMVGLMAVQGGSVDVLQEELYHSEHSDVEEKKRKKPVKGMKCCIYSIAGFISWRTLVT